MTKKLTQCKAIFVMITGLMLTSIFVDTAVATNRPPDPNTFLTMLERFKKENSTTANAYYAAIDPDTKKDTYENWLRETGFLQNGDPYSFSGPLALHEDSAVSHKNVADLNFVRVVRTRCVPNCDDPNPDIYSTIENYLNFDDSAARENRLASVTMEWTAAADGSRPSRKFATFYAFRGDNDSRNDSPGVPFAPDLDGRGKKQIPGLCNSCHGGEPRGLKKGIYRRKGNTGARFMALDLDNFEFNDANPALTRTAQQPEYKKANEAVLITHRSTKKFDEVAGISRVPGGHEMIEGWYGGPGLPSDTFDNAFTPPGWLPPNAPANAEALYHDVVVPACRNCHVQQERSLDFATYEGFRVFDDAIKELVFRHECGTDDDSDGRADKKDDQGVMPLALVTYDLFWAESMDVPLKEHVGAFECEK